MLLSLELVNVFYPGLNSRIHFLDFIILAARVLVVVALEFAHVTPTHLRIFHNELLVELSVEFVVLEREGLN